jgi:hypothetical protein
MPFRAFFSDYGFCGRLKGALIAGGAGLDE